MAKITKTSFQLGWIDGIERKVGRNLSLGGIDSQAYWRGVEREAHFRRHISVSQERRAEAAADERAARARLNNRGDGF